MSAFTDWAMADGRPDAEWVITRAEARELGRVIEAARRLVWICDQDWGVSADTATHEAWQEFCEAVKAAGGETETP